MRKLTKKMKVKDVNGITKITQSNLRGGMQDRLYRQELIRYADALRKHKKQKDNDTLEIFGIQSLSQEMSQEIKDFKEPVLRRIRSKRGFFDYE